MSDGFHEIRFPLRLSLGASGGPVRRVDIVDLSNGRENRNSRWRAARRRYDAGSGIRSLADLQLVLAFFEARGGPLYGFRYRDPFDWTSAAPGLEPSPLDQPLGTGDGQTAVFALAKTYGDAGGSVRRAIAKPVAGSVTVAVGGVPVPAGHFACDPASGLVIFAAGHIPQQGAAITAGYAFDVPVRFDADRIEASLEGFNAGRIPLIPLIEIKP